MEVIAVTISGVSLALSALALYRQWLANRQAAIEVRLESLPPRPGTAKHSGGLRLVLYNHGPHEAHGVDLQLQGRDGDPAGRVLDHHALPVPELYAKQDFYVGAAERIGERIVAAVVTWSDGRPGRHTKRVWLTRRQLS